MNPARRVWNAVGGRILARSGRVGYIETIGRRTGRTRSTPIGFARRADGALLVMAGGEGRGWSANLAANPSCTFRIRGECRPYRATELTGADAAAATVEFRAAAGGPAFHAARVFELRPE
jgi:deazaflavin-dependent oxidoreductase (nitroreductase family)